MFTRGRGLSYRRLGWLWIVVVALALTTWEESVANTEKETTMPFVLTSPAFKPNDRIPVKYTGEGADVSPPLEWANPPAGAKSFALICEDPNVPAGTWVHWVIWNLPTTLKLLHENVEKAERPSDLGGACQGVNSWPRLGYNGPMPPKGHGTHYYHFTLYALDGVLDLKAGADAKALLAAMKGHILGQATLMGTYSR